MKKIALILALVLVFACALVACDTTEETNSTPADESSVVENNSEEIENTESSAPEEESEPVDESTPAEESAPVGDGSVISEGKSYTYTESGLYYITWDESWAVSKNAATALTDGVTLGESIYYGDPTLTGWQGDAPVITIDLESASTVSGIKYYAYAGMDGIAAPAAVKVEVSTDGTNWTELTCTLTEGEKTVSNVNWAADGYITEYTLTASAAAEGQYVKVSFTKEGTFVFLTEIQVLG